jgi:hypothetical protein
VTPAPDDGEPRDEATPSGMDAGSGWLRAEMLRRMAENRSSRGRHARRGEQPAPSPADDPVPDVRLRERRPAAPDPWAAAYASPADLPENYVPRHSVQIPGPAAEPAAPISGPIPVVRPSGGHPAGSPAEPAPRAGGGGIVGGPSLPPTGLPIRRRKSSGPGTPLQGDGDASGPWSRPVPIVPNEPARRLGAPPEALGSPEAAPPRRPARSPSRGFALPLHPEVPDPVPPADAATRVDAPPSAAPAPATPVDDDATPDASVAVPVDRAAGVDETGSAADESEAASVETAEVPPPAAAAPAAPATSTAAPAESAVEVTGEILDSPTAPHPVVLARRATLSGRPIGVATPRNAEQARAVTPRPLTPRHIPIVGTEPAEPGSTRVRVVLSERKGVARPVRTIKEVQEGTAVGELLRRNLIRTQLRVTLRFAALTALVLGALPAVFALLPEVGRLHVLGVRLPWLLLGLLMYPFLVGVAWRYIRVADRVEQNFADHVQD